MTRSFKRTSDALEALDKAEEIFLGTSNPDEVREALKALVAAETALSLSFYADTKDINREEDCKGLHGYAMGMDHMRRCVRNWKAETKHG